MIEFFKQYCAWKRLRRDLFNSWAEKYSRVAVQLEIERLQKELYVVDAEIMAINTVKTSLKADLEQAKARLKDIEDYV